MIEVEKSALRRIRYSTIKLAELSSLSRWYEWRRGTCFLTPNRSNNVPGGSCTKWSRRRARFLGAAVGEIDRRLYTFIALQVHPLESINVQTVWSGNITIIEVQY